MTATSSYTCRAQDCFACMEKSANYAPYTLRRLTGRTRVCGIDSMSATDLSLTYTASFSLRAPPTSSCRRADFSGLLCFSPPLSRNHTSATRADQIFMLAGFAHCTAIPRGKIACRVYIRTTRTLTYTHVIYIIIYTCSVTMRVWGGSAVGLITPRAGSCAM